MTVSNHPDFSGFPPDDTAFPILGTNLSMRADAHPFHIAEQERAEANWSAEIARNPAFFNGKMVFFRDLHLEGGVISGTGHIIPYSTFLWWRRQADPASGYHLFAWPVILSCDGAVIAIRMSPHTANPGQVYCAAGSLDESDVADGTCDLMGNMIREVREETGLDLCAAEALPGWRALYSGRRVTVLRRFRFSEPADVLLARIARHMETDQEKEIDAAVAIRSPDPAAHPYNATMVRVLDLLFNDWKAV